MFAKSMIAATALAATLTAVAPMQPAAAKTNVDINLNFGGPGWYGDYYGDYPVRRHAHYYYDPAITCGEGAKVLKYNGFRAIEPVDCSLPRYHYMAWKNHRQYLVTVNRDGEITRARLAY
jgi:hypothetical protein